MPPPSVVRISVKLIPAGGKIAPNHGLHSIQDMLWDQIKGEVARQLETMCCTVIGNCKKLQSSDGNATVEQPVQEKVQSV